MDKELKQTQSVERRKLKADLFWDWRAFGKHSHAMNNKLSLTDEEGIRSVCPANPKTLVNNLLLHKKLEETDN